MGHMKLERLGRSTSVLCCFSLAACVACDARQAQNAKQSQQTKSSGVPDEEYPGKDVGAGKDGHTDDAGKNELGVRLLKNLARDEKAIWNTSLSNYGIAGMGALAQDFIFSGE